MAAYEIGYALGMAAFAYITLRLLNRRRRAGPAVMYEVPVIAAAATLILWITSSERASGDVADTFKLTHAEACLYNDGNPARCRCEADKIAAALSKKEIRELVKRTDYVQQPRVQTLVAQCRS